jgi:hypothetical protein
VIGAVIAGVLAFVVIAVVMARNTSTRKKRAIADLEQEKKTVGHYSIVDLVDAEVTDLGLRSIEGAEDIPPDVLLRVWSSSPDVQRCKRDDLRFVVTADVEAKDAGFDDVELACSGGASSVDETGDDL